MDLTTATAGDLVTSAWAWSEPTLLSLCQPPVQSICQDEYFEERTLLLRMLQPDSGLCAQRRGEPTTPQCTAPLHTEEEMNMILEAIASSTMLAGLPTTGALDASCPAPSSLATHRTTLMVRNVPVRYSLELLLEAWRAHSIDFLHLPWKLETQRNLSYCFLNFTSSEEALRFAGVWQKKRLPRYDSQKPLNIRYSDTQGLRRNLLLLKQTCPNLHWCKAAVFESGERVDLKDAMSKATSRRPATRASQAQFRDPPGAPGISASAPARKPGCHDDVHLSRFLL